MYLSQSPIANSCSAEEARISWSASGLFENVVVMVVLVVLVV